MDIQYGPSDEEFESVRQAVFTPYLLDYPWWKSITQVHQTNEDGTHPAYWSYRVASGNPWEDGELSKVFGYRDVHDMIHAVARERAHESVTATTRRECSRFLAKREHVALTSVAADEILQLLMFGEPLFDSAQL